MRKLLSLLAAGLLGSATAQESAPPAGLSAEEFQKVFELCRLKPSEASWDKLPWETNLWRAVEKASREKKLLLIWSAGGGGHPLGMC
jgi:hypothetical protein